ncbi:MAG: HAD family phosphatase [Pygmaiobacter sp.]
MLKNIVFDLGGVVVDYNPHDYLTERFLDKPLEDFLYEHIFASGIWRELDAGRITLSKGVQLMLADCSNHRYEAQMVLDDWRDMLTTKTDTVRLMEKLHDAGYHLYFLSDISADVLNIFREKKRFMRLFEGGIASCEVHLLKPERAIFTCLLDTYQLNPTETVFVDDLKENIDAAAELGFTTIPFKNTADLYKMLIFLGVPLQDPAAKKNSNRKKKPPAGKKPLFHKKTVPSKTQKTLSPPIVNSNPAKFSDPLEQPIDPLP